MIPYSNEYLLQYTSTLNNKDYISGLKGMEKGTNYTGRKIENTFLKIGKSISSIITPQNLATAALLGFTYQVSKSVKNMILYEKKLDKVNTLLKVGKSELNAYGFELKNLSSKLGVDSLGMLEASYQALSAGVKKNNLIEFMEIASKGAIAGATNTETAITALTSVINSYKLETSDAKDVMDLLLTIQAKGVTTLGELGSVIGEVTSISSVLGVNLDDLGAAIAQITQNGNNTAKTMTMLKQMFAELSKEGQQADKNFRKITKGKSFKDFISEGNSLSDALNLMNEYAKKNNKSIIDMFGSIEAGSAALNLTGKNINDFNDKLNDMKNKAGETKKAYILASNNIASEWKKLTGSVSTHWQSIVTKLEKPITITLRTIRQGIDGESNLSENIQYKKLELQDLKEQIAEKEKQLQIHKDNYNKLTNNGKDTYKVNKYIADERKIQSAIGGLNVKKYNLEVFLEPQLEKEKTNQAKNEMNNFHKEIQEKMVKAKDYEKNGYKGREKEYKIFLLSLRNLKNKNKNIFLSDFGFQNNNELENKIKKVSSKIEMLTTIKIKSEEDLKEEMLRIDKEILTNKSNQLSNLNDLYNKGNIDKKEYDAKLKELDSSNTLNQQREYKKALESLKSFYEERGNIIESNKLDKQILEIEVKIKGLEGQKMGAVDDSELQDFRNKQLEDEENFRTEQLKREWEFLEKKGALKIQGKISDEQFENDKQAFKLSQSIAQEEFNIIQLEKKRDFYLQQGNMEKEAYNLQKQIIKRKEDLEKGAKKIQATKLKWNTWAENKKVDIQAKSANALLDTYSALAKGQIKSLDDFKKFAKMQLAELLLAKGQEHASLAISDTAKGISFAANPLTASLAPPEFMSAAKNAALAATWGVAAATLNSSDENEESNSSKKEITQSKYDEGIEKRSELGKKESEGNVIIDVSDSQMAKIMIKQIEKELNDGYNVTLIGKKK